VVVRVPDPAVYAVPPVPDEVVYQLSKVNPAFTNVPVFSATVYGVEFPET
jgi:hypothetical protein